MHWHAGWSSNNGKRGYPTYVKQKLQHGVSAYKVTILDGGKIWTVDIKIKVTKETNSLNNPTNKDK